MMRSGALTVKADDCPECLVGSHDIYVAHGAHTINEVAQSLGLDAVVVGNKNKWFHGTKIRKRWL